MALLASGCATSSGTAKTEALIATASHDDTRDNLALNSRILAMANTDNSTRDYAIGPGDLLEISVFDIPELSKIKARVTTDGLITLPLAGAVPAGGKTAVELEEAVKGALAAKYIRDPQVSVFVLEYRSQKVSVLGAVKKPGSFEINGPRSLVDMLAMSEGLAEYADSTVYIMRKVAKSSTPAGSSPQQQGAPNGKPADAEDAVIQINLEEALVNGQEAVNMPLRSGDVIHVPKAGSFFVGGSVQRPGSYVLKGKSTTVDQAIIEAGGVNRVADLDSVRILRKGGAKGKEIMEVSLNEVEKGKQGPIVMKNDVIMVGTHAGWAFWFGFLDMFRIGASVF